MIKDIKKLVVKYNDRIVGYLATLDNNRIGFQYDDEWIRYGFCISPFSLPLSHDVFVNSKDTFDGLYGVFHDSLPNGWGALLIKRMMAKKGVNYDRLSPLTKLALISNNGLGGLTYEPCISNSECANQIDLDVLFDDVQKIFDNEQEEANLDKVFALGGSSGGARPKAHVRLNGEEWIIKFPCRIDPENIGVKEYEANKTARKCGIDVNEYKLFSSTHCGGYFGAKRFDRKENRRVHMISLSALLETTHRVPNLDYMHLFEVIQQICENKSDLYEAYRRMVFNVFYKNRDDHGKNFSFLYDEELGGYCLSPAYDLTCTPEKAEHEMTVLGNGLPQEKDMLELGRRMILQKKECEKIIKTIKSGMEKQ